MELLVIAALVFVLVVLLAARSAQRAGDHQPESAAEESDRHAEPPAEMALFARPAGTPRPDQAGKDIDFFDWESLQIARRGEARAGNLDFFAYVVVALACLTMVGAACVAFGGDLDLGRDGKVLLALGTAGSVLSLGGLAALLLGFSALVRNSSRGLRILANQGKGREAERRR